MIKRITEFLSEVRLELKKVSWTTKRELISSTWVVIFSVIIITVFIMFSDFILRTAMRLVI